MARAFPFGARDGRDGLVRVARARDARACLAISAEVIEERPRTLAVVREEIWRPRQWRQRLLDWGPKGVSLVAVIDGEIVGSLSVHRGGRVVIRHAAEFGLAVAARARGIGVGRALIQAAEAWAAEFGVTRMTLGVFAGNERAHGLYRSLGYQEEGVEHGGVRFAEGSIDVIRMYKVLGGG